VLLVSIDTLRADHLGCYGARDAETPAIDALATEGALFLRAYSPLPMTLPAHATMMTGLQPLAHGLVDNGITSADLGAATLAERLSAGGYDTAAFAAAFVLNRMFGLDRGFALYDDGPPEETELVGLFRRVADARERVDAAIDWLGRPRQRPFFLWLHLFDVHAPHVAPEPFARRFASDPYSGEVAYVDSQVRRLLEYLKWRGLEGRTLVVLTSDHGESLGEHGEKTHGFFLYDATLRVPLIVRLPGRIPAGRRVEEAATLADLSPTILDLLGLPPNPRSHGVALFAAPAARLDRALWAQSDYPLRQYGWARLRSVRRGTWKYIDAPRPELYDLASDPGETRNLAATAGGRAREMADLIGRTETTLSRDKPQTERKEPDGDAQARLATLGYLAGGDAATRAPTLDPAEAIKVQEEVDNASSLLAAGGPGLAQAETLFRGLIRRFPRKTSLRINLGRTLEELGREEEAAAVYREAAKGAELRSMALGRLVYLAGKSGRVEEEVAAARDLVESFPRHAASRRLLADALARQGQLAEAEAAYRGSLALEPGSRSTRVHWCRFLIEQGRVAEAEPVLTALATESRDAEVAALEGELTEARKAVRPRS
jgi:arylsulfatase A-like enzyme/thioredoxin-like negative regulator of GroEL